MPTYKLDVSLALKPVVLSDIAKKAKRLFPGLSPFSPASLEMHCPWCVIDRWVLTAEVAATPTALRLQQLFDITALIKASFPRNFIVYKTTKPTLFRYTHEVLKRRRVMPQILTPTVLDPRQRFWALLRYAERSQPRNIAMFNWAATAVQRRRLSSSFDDLMQMCLVSVRRAVVDQLSISDY